MKPIGGFFEIEIPRGNKNYHKRSIALSTGRACLHLFLKKIKPKKLYIPYYTCDALFEPIVIHKTKYFFYPIDKNLEPVQLPSLKAKEYFLYINYFGIKRNTVTKLIKKYGPRLIVDNSHDFFSTGKKNIWSFTTARKFFGVPDGAFLYSPKKIPVKFKRNTDISIDHLVNRLLGEQETAFGQFQTYEKSLNSEIKSISHFSDNILSNLDYHKIKKNRRNNFTYLKNSLDKYNTLNISYTNGLNPFCYPLLPKKSINKKIFHKNKFFIPSLWLDTIHRNIKGFETEKFLSKNLLPLPIDHRYTKEDLKPLVTFITKLLKNSK